MGFAVKDQVIAIKDQQENIQMSTSLNTGCVVIVGGISISGSIVGGISISDSIVGGISISDSIVGGNINVGHHDDVTNIETDIDIISNHYW